MTHVTFVLLRFALLPRVRVMLARTMRTQIVCRAHSRTPAERSACAAAAPLRRAASGKRRRQADAEALDPIEDAPPERAAPGTARAGTPPAAAPACGARALPAGLADSPAANRQPAPGAAARGRFAWDLGSTLLLLDGMETWGSARPQLVLSWLLFDAGVCAGCVASVVPAGVLLTRRCECAAGWARIQEIHFPNHPGTSMQNKLKDKWRVLCEGSAKRHKTRTVLPENAWKRIETLAKQHRVK